MKSGEYYGFKILDTVKIRNSSDIANIQTAIQSAIDEGREPAMCFEPRHGVRIREGGVTTDYLICLECSYVHIYTNGNKKIEVIEPKHLEMLNGFLKP